MENYELKMQFCEKADCDVVKYEKDGKEVCLSQNTCTEVCDLSSKKQ